MSSEPATADTTPPNHVALIGLMAVGKTSVGRLLAAKLQRPLCDSDEEIERREGENVRQIQDERGRAALHALEARVLLDALAGAQASVICAAASTIDDPRCRAALRGPAVIAVWLQANLDTMVRRYDDDPHRPRYPEGTRAALASQLAARWEHFAQVAAITVAVDDLTAAEVAARVESLL